jgi:hypothetical protein
MAKVQLLTTQHFPINSPVANLEELVRTLMAAATM